MTYPALSPMRITAVPILLAMAALACSAGPAPEVVTPAAPKVVAPPGRAVMDAFVIVAEMERLATRDLWPGFDPRSLPVAIFDGQQTLLFHHPAPPEGFRPVPGGDDVHAYTGRHPSVTANSSAVIGGIPTATLMPIVAAEPLRERAGILIHEAFHVFQRQHHPGWIANEVDLFTYPVDDPSPLAMRRIESAALRQALTTGDVAVAACWARIALTERQYRFAALPVAATVYEQRTELNEGLASYVEQRATGQLASTMFPNEEFLPEEVRVRAYHSGVALARLLDRFAPDWHARLVATDSMSLEGLLAAWLAPVPRNRTPCDFGMDERNRMYAAAAADVADLHARRAKTRAVFLEQPGWRLVIIAGANALFAQEFDPLNVQLVTGGDVLHSRFLKLGHNRGTIEVLGRGVLTESAGVHPLFNGVRSLIVAGLPREPVITETQGAMTIAADGVTAELRGAVVSRSGQTMTITLP